MRVGDLRSEGFFLDIMGGGHLGLEGYNICGLSPGVLSSSVLIGMGKRIQPLHSRCLHTKVSKHKG